MLSDIEISQQNQPEPILNIAQKVGLSENDVELYGKYKAKISFEKLKELSKAPLNGKLILVTAITPTPAGEGKSTLAVGLAEMFASKGSRVLLIDGDLRKQDDARLVGRRGGAGLAEAVRGDQPAGELILKALGKEAPLHCDMCLGEGTGAVAFFPVLDMAAAVYRQMSTFADIQVEEYQELGDK